MKFISIRLLLSGYYSVDIADNPHLGGFCRLFRYIGDALIWIKEQTGKDIPSNWPDLNSWNWANDFKAEIN